MFVNIVLISVHIYGLIIFYQQFETRINKSCHAILPVYVQKKEHIILKNCLTIIKNHVNNELLGDYNLNKF